MDVDKLKCPPFGDNSEGALQCKDAIWHFLMKGSQKSDIPLLKESVNTLIKATTQKTAGQRKNKTNHIDWKELDMVCWTILMEAVALVLSGDLDRLEESHG